MEWLWETFLFKYLSWNESNIFSLKPHIYRIFRRMGHWLESHDIFQLLWSWIICNIYRIELTFTASFHRLFETNFIRWVHSVQATASTLCWVEKRQKTKIGWQFIALAFIAMPCSHHGFTQEYGSRGVVFREASDYKQKQICVGLQSRF